MWIDPLADGWFADPEGLIGHDGVYPTDAGHRMIADRVDPVLVARSL